MTDITRIQDLAGLSSKRNLITELKRSRDQLTAAHDRMIKQVEVGAVLDEGLFQAVSTALKAVTTIGTKGAAAAAERTRGLSSGIKQMYLDGKAQQELRDMVGTVQHLNKVLSHVDRECPTILSRDSEIKTVMGLMRDVLIKLVDQLTSRLAVPRMHAEGVVTANDIEHLLAEVEKYHNGPGLHPTNCDECSKLMAYMSSHPRGYMICPECHDAEAGAEPGEPHHVGGRTDAPTE
jgi:hypothetical protein